MLRNTSVSLAEAKNRQQELLREAAQRRFASQLRRPSDSDRRLGRALQRVRR